jgi:hypothetical protein
MSKFTEQIEVEIEGLVAPLRQKEAEYGERLSKGQVKIDAEADQRKKNELQAKANFLKNMAFRLKVAGDILQGDVVLVAQKKGEILICYEVDEGTKKLIGVVEEHGGVVVEVTHIEKVEQRSLL